MGLGNWGAEYYGVTQYGSSTHDYSLWGRRSNGSKFCCVVDHETPASTFTKFYLVVVGGPNDDELSWEYGSEEFDVSAAPSGVQVAGEMYGGSGDDTLQGATQTVNNVEDQTFWGQMGDDEITTGGGKATAYGGIGGDTIYADSPHTSSLVYGDLGSFSTVFGGADTIIGGDHSGLDAYGEGGNDTICGSDVFDDTLAGGEGDDTLWSAGSVIIGGDRLFGDGGSDACGNASATKSSCESALTVAPAACP